jgi:hypothetical protein
MYVEIGETTNEARAETACGLCRARRSSFPEGEKKKKKSIYHYSLITIHYSLFTIDYSLFTKKICPYQVIPIRRVRR